MTEAFETQGSERGTSVQIQHNDAVTEITREREHTLPAPHYSVSLAMTTTTTDEDGQGKILAHYEIPIITISYQAGPYMNPVEVGHIYIRTQSIDPLLYSDRQMVANLYQGYMGSIREQLNGFALPREQLFTHHHINGEYTNVTTLFVGATPTGTQALKDAGYFAYAQIFNPHKSSIVSQPRLNGYDPFIVLKAVSHLCILPAQTNVLGSGYTERDSSMNVAQTIAVLVHNKQLPNQTTLAKFETPHTAALGNYSASSTGEVYQFPDRSVVGIEKKRRGIGVKDAAPTKASQLG